jgi:hypothetical protein
MPNPNLDTLTREVNETVGVIESATSLINGFQAKLDAAIAAALANGATEAELAPLATLSVELDSKTNDLAAAVAANS